tara:strand:- start:21 stop:710 length:690 start_codon:yes stop_codon:yes gene_type:complete
MKEIKFKISDPLNINQFFEVLEDKSVWCEKNKYVRRGANWVPNREFTLRFSELLIPNTEKIKRLFSKKSKYNYGIYILLFNDFDQYYVGIAARYSKLDKNKNLSDIKDPEGFLTRLRKHRAKCTGTYYNISHTERWRDFAIERFKFYKRSKVKDIMSDCQLSLIFFEDHEQNRDNDFGLLEELEHHINQSNISKIVGEGYSNFSPIATTKDKELNYIPILTRFDIKTLI